MGTKVSHLSEDMAAVDPRLRDTIILLVQYDIISYDVIL